MRQQKSPQEVHLDAHGMTAFSARTRFLGDTGRAIFSMAAAGYSRARIKCDEQVPAREKVPLVESTLSCILSRGAMTMHCVLHRYRSFVLAIEKKRPREYKIQVACAPANA